MRVVPVVLIMIALSTAGCVEALEDAAESLAAAADSCSGTSQATDGGTPLPIPIQSDGSFQVGGGFRVLVLAAEINATQPGFGTLEVRDPDDHVVFRLELTTGGSDAEGQKEITGATPGTYTIWFSGSPDAAYELVAAEAGCGGDDNESGNGDDGTASP